MSAPFRFDTAYEKVFKIASDGKAYFYFCSFSCAGIERGDTEDEMLLKTRAIVSDIEESCEQDEDWEF